MSNFSLVRSCFFCETSPTIVGVPADEWCPASLVGLSVLFIFRRVELDITTVCPAWWYFHSRNNVPVIIKIFLIVIRITLMFIYFLLFIIFMQWQKLNIPRILPHLKFWHPLTLRHNCQTGLHGRTVRVRRDYCKSKRIKNYNLFTREKNVWCMGPSTARSLIFDFISKVVFPSRQIDHKLIKMPGRPYRLIALVGRKGMILGGNQKICCIDTINDVVYIYFLWSLPILLLLAVSFPTASCCMLILHLKVWILYLSVSAIFSKSNLNQDVQGFN